LHLNIKIVDEYGQYLDAGKDIAMLKSVWGEKSKQVFSKIIQRQNVDLSPLLSAVANKIDKNDSENNNITLKNIETQNIVEIKDTNKNNQNINLNKENITTWNFGTLAKTIETQKGQLKIIGYPALVEHENKQSCYIKVFDTQEQAQSEHIKGIKRLFALQIKEHIKKITKDFSNQPQLGVNYLSLGNANELYEQIIDSALCISFMPQLSKFGNINNLHILGMNDEFLPQNAEQFQQFLEQGKQRFGLIVQEIKNMAMDLLKQFVNISKKLAGIANNSTYAYAVKDMQQQLSWLISKDFLTKHSYEQLKRFTTYLQGIEFRVEKLKSNANDAQASKDLSQIQSKWQQQLSTWHKQGLTKILGERYIRFLQLPYAWQELRITLFAQSLKTAYPISIKRLEKMWLEIVG
jgi:ATP-dependent helicase HrpA